MSDINDLSNHKKRIKWLDFAKGVTILFVVLVHLIGYIKFSPKFVSIFSYIVFTFVMSVFFTISGFLYKPTNTWKKYKILLYKKCSSFIIPYFIFTCVNIFCINIHQSLQLFFNNGLKIFYLPIGYLWFLYTLFFIFIFVGAMDLFHVNFYIQCIIAIILLLISCRMSWDFYYQNNGQNLYPIIRICGYIICFYIGIIIRKYNLVNILRNKWFMFISLIIWILSLTIQYHIDSKFDTNSFGYVNLFTKILSIFVLLSIFINFKQNNWIFRYFDKYGKYTLLIYLTHIPIMILSDKFLAKVSIFNTHTIIDFPIMFILCWFGSIVICHFALKYKAINFIYYPRKYINKLI